MHLWHWEKFQPPRVESVQFPSIINNIPGYLNAAVQHQLKFVGQLSVLSTSISLVIGLIPLGCRSALALPPPEDTPEEILRTEIILAARSPIDGKPLTAAEYAQLQAKLQSRPSPPQLNPKVRETIFLLQLRRAIRTVLPFLPI